MGPLSSQMVTLRLNSMHNRFMVRKSTRDLVPSSWSELWAWKQRPILSSISAGSIRRWWRCWPIVLMGHRDTVFPDGTVAQRPFRIDGNQAFGPGVADMKAGLVMNTFVLEALHRFGCPCPLTGLYTSDEEIASPSSRPRPKQREHVRCSTPSLAARAATSSRAARVPPLSN